MKYLWLPILLCAFLAAPLASRADALSDGMAAYDAKDYAKAYELLLPLADAGANAEACYRLGLMYDSGNGMTRDLSKAVKYYESAAAKGHGKGAFNAGVMYLNGDGVTMDYAKASELFQIGAEAGDLDSQLNLGLMLAAAKGVERNLSLAFKWLFLASDSGEPKAIEAVRRFRTVTPPDVVAEGRRLATAWQSHRR